MVIAMNDARGFISMELIFLLFVSVAVLGGLGYYAIARTHVGPSAETMAGSTASTTAFGVQSGLAAQTFATSSIVGMWRSNGNWFTFRADGTFAEGLGTKIVNYTEKCAMDTGDCSGLEYPSSATSTGLWNVVADPSKEMVTNEFDDPPTSKPLLTLISKPSARNSIILRLDDGNADVYEYLEVSFVKAGQTARWSYPLVRQLIGEYRKVSN